MRLTAPTALNNTKFLAISLLVVAMHIVAILLLSVKQQAQTLNRPQKLLVQTIALEKLLNAHELHELSEAAGTKSLPIPNPIDNIITISVEPKEAKSIPEEISYIAEKVEVEKKAPAPTHTPATKAESKKSPPVVKAEPKKSIPVKAKAPPPPAKTTVKKPEAKTEPLKDIAAENAASAAKAEAIAKKRKLLAEAQKSLGKSGSPIAKIEKVQTPQIALAQPPSGLAELQIDSIPYAGGSQGISIEMNYSQELSSRLKRLLRLPQYGEVDIKLTLLRSGKVAKLEIVDSQNPINKEHVEKVLPTLQFSPFGSSFAGEDQHIFKIKLRHE